MRRQTRAAAFWHDGLLSPALSSKGGESEPRARCQVWPLSHSWAGVCGAVSWFGFGAGGTGRGGGNGGDFAATAGARVANAGAIVPTSIGFVASSIGFVASSIAFAPTSIGFAISSAAFVASSIGFAASSIAFATSSTGFASSSAAFVAMSLAFWLAREMRYALTMWNAGVADSFQRNWLAIGSASETGAGGGTRRT